MQGRERVKEQKALIYPLPQEEEEEEEEHGKSRRTHQLRLSIKSSLMSNIRIKDKLDTCQMSHTYIWMEIS